MDKAGVGICRVGIFSVHLSFGDDHVRRQLFQGSAVEVVANFSGHRQCRDAHIRRIGGNRHLR